MKKMKLNYIIVAFIAVMFAMTNLTQAGDVKIALDCPPDPDKCGTYVWATAFAKHLEENGLKTKTYPRGGLGGEEEKLDQVSQGLLEVSCSDLAKTGQLNNTIFGFTLPYMFQSIAHLDRVVANTDLMKTVNKGTSKKGVRVLALIPAGAFSGLANTKRPIKTPVDMKGLRIRAKDKNQAKYIEAWGANTVIIPWAEIYNSLQTGVADGYLNPSIVPIMFKHTEVLKYFSNVKFSAPLRVGICSEDWYSGLSQKKRAIVDEAVVKADKANRLWQAKVEKRGLEDLKSAGIKVYVNSPKEIAEFKKLVQPLYSTVVSEKIAQDFIISAEANR